MGLCHVSRRRTNRPSHHFTFERPYSKQMDITARGYSEPQLDGSIFDPKMPLWKLQVDTAQPASGSGAVAVARWGIFPIGINLEKTRISNIEGHKRSQVSGTRAETASFCTNFSRSCPAFMSSKYESG